MFSKYRPSVFAISLSAALLCLPLSASANPYTQGIQPPKQQMRMQLIKKLDHIKAEAFAKHESLRHQREDYQKSLFAAMRTAGGHPQRDIAGFKAIRARIGETGPRSEWRIVSSEYRRYATDFSQAYKKAMQTEPKLVAMKKNYDRNLVLQMTTIDHDVPAMIQKLRSLRAGR